MSMTALRLVSTVGMQEEEWLRIRRQGIGGSDIAAIAGVHPWRSPLSVYLEKMGELEPEENEAMRWGRILEPIVAQEFARRYPDYQVRRVNAVLQHPEVPYFLANIDREVRRRGSQPGVLEIKTSSAWMGGRWHNEVPDHVMAQVQWYLGITGYTWAVVAVLIGGNDYREFEIERDDEVIELLQQIGKKFWEDHVIPKVPPAAEAVDLDVLKQLHPESNGQEISLPPTAYDLFDEYDHAKLAYSEAEKRLNAVKAKLQALLGDNECGVLGARKVCWPTVTTVRLDAKRLQKERPDIYEEYVKEASYRRFQVI